MGLHSQVLNTSRQRGLVESHDISSRQRERVSKAWAKSHFMGFIGWLA